MLTPRSLDILFLTNFSDNCAHSIPAIARMAEALKVRLTVMHVYDPACCTQSDAEAQLSLFFPDIGHYASCHRIALPGPLLDVVRSYLEVWPVNLIVAPASDPMGFRGIGRRSTRSRLVKECGVPIWTIGRRVQTERLYRPVQNVACWLDFHSSETDHLAFAMEYAGKLKAKLHLLRALPEIHEGSLIYGAANQGKMLFPSGASDEILRLCSNSPIRPEVHVSSSQDHFTLASMLQDCEADVVFLRNEESSLVEWLGRGLRLGDNLPCSAIYISDRVKSPVWNLKANRAMPATVERWASLSRRGA